MGNLDAADHALRRRAEMQVAVQSRPGIRGLFLGHLEAIGNTDSGYFQHAADIFDVTNNGCLESILEGTDLFFGQHRGQSSHHSAAHGADHVIERGGMLFFR